MLGKQAGSCWYKVLVKFETCLMKNYLLFALFLVCFPFMSFGFKDVKSVLAAAPQDVLEQIDSLTNNGQFSTAWTLLCTRYPDDDDNDKEAVIIKSNFCLQYFSHTAHHTKFYFANLSDTQTLISIRTKDLSPQELWADFNPETELLETLKKWDGDAHLHFALGTFYYDVMLTYHNQWKKGAKETMALSYYHFLEAYKKDKKSALSCYAISYFYQKRQTNQKAKKFLKEAISIDPNYAAAHYNLAYSYTEEDSLALAITHAQEAFDHYQIKSFKSDAALMSGILFGDLNNHDQAIKWLLVADALSPGDMMVYKGLLKGYLAAGMSKEASLITKNLYAYDWKTAAVFNFILDAHIKEDKINTIKLFLENEIKLKPFDKEYQGFNHIHLAQIYLHLNENNLATTHLTFASNAFNLCYNSDHAIYRVLEKLNWTAKQAAQTKSLPADKNH